MPSLDVPSCNLWLWLIRVCLTSPQLLDLSLFYCSLYMVTGPLFTCASLSLLASPHGHVSQHPSILATICWALPAVPMSPLTCKHKLTQRWRLLSTKIFPSAAGHSSWCSPIYGLYWTLRTGFSCRGPLGPLQLPSAPMCWGYSAPDSELCVSPLWTSWDFYLPGPHVSRGPFGLEFCHSVCNSLPQIQYHLQIWGYTLSSFRVLMTKFSGTDPSIDPWAIALISS